MIVSGEVSTNIVNTSTGEMQTLIQAPTDGSYGANMGFFKQLPGGGFEFHFLESSKEEQKDYWRSMWFDADFIEVTKQCGQIPGTTVKDLVAEKANLIAKQSELVKERNALAEEKTALIAKQ